MSVPLYRARGPFVVPSGGGLFLMGEVLPPERRRSHAETGEGETCGDREERDGGDSGCEEQSVSTGTRFNV